MYRRPDPSSDRPLYRQIADILRDQITSGTLPAGVTIHPEARLAGDYEVGLGTVREALAVLRGEGLIVTERGKPARVAERLEVQVRQIPPGARIRVRMPSDAERRELGATEGRVVPEGVPVIVVEMGGRTEVLAGDRVVLETVTAE